jgi:hypothetical protein
LRWPARRRRPAQTSAFTPRTPTRLPRQPSTRFPDAESLTCLAGVAPSTRASGRHRTDPGDEGLRLRRRPDRPRKGRRTEVDHGGGLWVPRWAGPNVVTLREHPLASPRIRHGTSGGRTDLRESGFQVRTKEEEATANTRRRGLLTPEIRRSMRAAGACTTLRSAASTLLARAVHDVLRRVGRRPTHRASHGMRRRLC